MKDIKTKNAATIDVKVYNENVIKIFSGTGVVTKDISEVTITLAAVSAEEQEEQEAACAAFTATISDVTLSKIDPTPSEVINVGAVINNPNNAEVKYQWISVAASTNGNFADVAARDTTFTAPSTIPTNPYSIGIKVKICPTSIEEFCKESRPKSINVITDDGSGDGAGDGSIKLIITSSDGSYSGHPAVEINEGAPQKEVKFEAVATNGVTYSWEEDGVILGSN